MKAPQSPCMRCGERVQGCHGRCERYGAFQTAVKEYHAEKRKVYADNECARYMITAARKYKDIRLKETLRRGK